MRKTNVHLNVVLVCIGAMILALAGAVRQSAAEDAVMDPIMYGKAEPSDNPTAEEIIKKQWCLFHTQQADTYMYRKIAYEGQKYDCMTTRLNKRGQIRKGAAERAIQNFHGVNGIDYKDHIIYWSPEDIRGKALLIWSYIDKNREEDTWLWLPSLRKIRRVPGSQKEDYHFGTDMSYADLSLRVPSDENHSIIGVKKFDEEFYKMAQDAGAIPRVINWWKDHADGEELWVIESKQNQGYITYDKRVSYIIKTGKQKYQDWFIMYYDAKGRLVKIWDTYWQEDPDHLGWFGEGLRHFLSTATGHQSFFDVLPPVFDIPIPEIEFTQAILPQEASAISPAYMKEKLGKDYDTFIPWVKYGLPWENLQQK